MCPFDRLSRLPAWILVLATLMPMATAHAQRPRGRVSLPPDLAPIVSQSSDPALPGRTHTYRVTVLNRGAGPAPSFRLQTRLSRWLEPTGVQEANGFDCDDRDLFRGSGRTRNCTGPALRPGEAATFTVTGRLPRRTWQGETLVFSVHVDPHDRITERSEYNNRARVSARIGKLPLAEYRVGLDEMRGVALLHGWQFRVSERRGACGFDGPAIRYSLRSYCTFRLFYGREKLAEPWRVKRVVVSNPRVGLSGTCAIVTEHFPDLFFDCSTLPENDPDPSLRITVRSDRDPFGPDFGSAWRWNVEYVLEGPEQDDWRKAFE